MKFTVQRNFGTYAVREYVEKAFAIWSKQRPISHLDFSGAEGSERVNAEVGIFGRDGKTILVAVSHEFVSLSLAFGSAEEGNPVSRDSISFKYLLKAGKDKFPSVTANANVLLAPTAEVSNYRSEIENFTLPVKVIFSRKQVESMLKEAVEKGTGKTAFSAALYLSETRISATISMNMPGHNTVRLAHNEFAEAFTSELAARGYDVETDGLEFVYDPNCGQDGLSSIFVHVRLARLPA